MKEEKLTAKECIRRGNAKHKAGEYKEAVIHYDKAIELDPKCAVAYNDRAVTNNRIGRYQEAIADCNKAIELDPDPYNVSSYYSNRGVAKRMSGDLKGAIVDYNKSVELKPDYFATYGNRATAKTALGDFEGAIADCNMVLKLKPKSSGAYYSRAIAKARMGDFQGSLADLEKTEKLKHEDKFIGDQFHGGEPSDGKKAGRPKGGKYVSYDEERHTYTKDYKRELTKDDYVNAILNLQLSTEMYLRLRMLQKFGFKYKETAQALGIPLTTLYGTVDKIVEKLQKTAR